MPKYTTFQVWFDHPKGPYSGAMEAKNESEVENFWRDCPFYIGCNVLGDDKNIPSVVQEEKAL